MRSPAIAQRNILLIQSNYKRKGASEREQGHWSLTMRGRALLI
jgi:hypothetical protein